MLTIVSLWSSANCSQIVRNMVNITKSQNKVTQEMHNVVNNVSDNIYDVVNDYANNDGGYIPENNEVHVGFAPVNEGVTKDASGKRIFTNVFIASLDSMSFHFKKSVLKWKYLYLKRIALKRKLSKEALTFKEVV